MDRRNWLGTFSFLLLLCSLFLALTGCSSAEEEEPTGRIVGEVVFINGTVNVLGSESGEIVPAAMQTRLLVDDRIAVEAGGLLRFDLEAGTLVYAMPMTVFNIDDTTPDEEEATPLIDLEIGSMWVLQPKGTMTVKTPLGEATAKQAHMRISYDTDPAKGIIIDCLSGTCEFATLVDTFVAETGESIRFNNSASPEMGYEVAEEIVEEWLTIYPLATMILPELSETPTPPIPENPVVIVNGTECPIQPGWQATLVGAEQTLATLADAYDVTLTALASANCMDEGASIAAGTVIYIPVIQQSLTPTLTATLTPTITLTPTVTLTPTATITPTVPSPTPESNENTAFDIQVAPYTAISNCEITFRVHATDPEKVSTVKVQISLNDETFSSAQLINLPHIGDDVFELSTIIDTSQTGADLVYWRLMSTDLQNNVQVYPNPPQYYWYNDPLDCVKPEITKTPTQTPMISQTPTATPTPTPTPTPEETVTPDDDTPTHTHTPTSTEELTNAEFSNPIGPRDVAIINCLNTYSVEVTDPDGVSTVSVQYAVNDETFSHSDTIQLSHQGANLYGDILRLDTSTNPGSDVVYWRFELIDNLGNTEYYPAIPYNYTDTLDCTTP